ncbi:DEAD/DEAH box helicase [Mitsuokella sp.]|uniref:DEAD/DEAH box helicase n=1 Tax=Mitsuokella sp. TaxID=2049034 RepID=UPI003D7EF735
MNNITDSLLQGQKTAFFDARVNSAAEYRPQFVYNDYHKDRKVLSALEREFEHCESFCISVAFITMSGITPLLGILRELEERKIPGRILTTNYLNFSDPKALKKLQAFSNIELRMYWTDEGAGFHTKGYIFRCGDVYRMIVGSSNLTAAALTKNEEWNTKLISLHDGEYTQSMLTRFEDLWTDEKHTRSFALFYDAYQKIYQHERERMQAKQGQSYELPHADLPLAAEDADSVAMTGTSSALRPNLMQEEFIESLRALRHHKARRALLISATGTGKTYASAFAARDFQSRRMLFVVHREQIAKQALKSYRRVLGENIDAGLLSGTAKDVDAQYLFATIQTLSREDVLHLFSPNAFDLIIIDEVHRAGAASYQKLLDYFTPVFCLGMTASPDRPDCFDIYALFDHNIAYEIRLQQALTEDLLCPFHYFGIHDISLGERTYAADEVHDEHLFQKLTGESRVEHIIREAEFYGFSGSRVKGLIFCSTNREAEILSQKFNEHGLRTLSLSGKNSQAEREAAISRLIEDDIPNPLDYILTVDIFNEGVDIPEINQVIMLRPTQSPIVFIQQLGRGLRKAEGKEYVVILDFIGNYSDKNYLIPIALSGDRSYNKDNIRHFLLEGERMIPGASTIHFDAVAREQIFHSIDQSNLAAIQLIKDNYFHLRYKLGRIPKLDEFDRFGEMDITCVFRANRLGSYHAFLKKYEKDYRVAFNALEEKFLQYISKEFAEGKRPHELLMLDIILQHPGEKRIFHVLERRLSLPPYEIAFKRNTRQNLIHIMTGDFATGASRKTFQDCIFIEPCAGDYTASASFRKLLQHEDFRSQIDELVRFGLRRYRENYSNPYQDSGFQLYQKYDYEDVCRIMDWSHSLVPLNIGGYKYDAESRTYPVFINYDKAADVQDSINYHDRFLNNGQLISISKSKRSLDSEDVQRFCRAKAEGLPIDLFVRKNKEDKEAKSFYYLGRMTNHGAEPIKMDSGDTAVELFWQLDTAVREDLYDYLTSKEA